MGILTMNEHAFKNFVVCKNDFFKNPNKVLTLFDRQEYIISPAFPGRRTNNLLDSTDLETKNFARFFAKKICDEMFPGVFGLMIDVRFHINETYKHSLANQGWIHCDDADLAGLVYMTPEECSLDTGTSIFKKTTTEDFAVEDFKSRNDFNTTGIVSDAYLKELTDNHKIFFETIRVGNVYNRAVAYDATMFHRPNRYNLDCNMPRKSIVFFIRNFKRDFQSKIQLEYFWEDV